MMTTICLIVWRASARSFDTGRTGLVGERVGESRVKVGSNVGVGCMGFSGRVGVRFGRVGFCSAGVAGNDVAVVQAESINTETRKIILLILFIMLLAHR